MKKYWNNRGVTDDVLEWMNIGHVKMGSWKWYTFPIMDFDGKTLFYKLKKIGEDKKQPRYIYQPKGQEPTLYPLPMLHRGIRKIYLCEGESDVLTMLSLGKEAITSTSGAGVFRKEWLKYFLKGITVVCCYDRDEAGEKGRSKIEKIFSERKDITLKHLRIPKECPGKDITDYILWKQS